MQWNSIEKKRNRIPCVVPSCSRELNIRRQYLIFTFITYTFQLCEDVCTILQVWWAVWKVVPLPIYEYCTIKQLYPWAIQILSPSVCFLVPQCFSHYGLHVLVSLRWLPQFGVMSFGKHMNPICCTISQRRIRYPLVSVTWKTTD